MSRPSTSTQRLKSRPVSAVESEVISVSRSQTASPDRSIKPPLTKSLFPNIPPVVTFVAEGDKGIAILINDLCRICYVA
ncbi:hypothetical protein DPMN_060821 [Dreissena polymorpha]|uniref:Uncharacterized protein n=1 Tax=Dreissena polymorpha TaxID=45954 RepID=A0A9D4HHX3_DREPO|nr:hypothetical protein DPMN_060821 [Dreissena polymorpha]